VAEHPRLQPKIVPQRVTALVGVFAELQQERRERVSRGSIPSDAAQSFAETPRQRGGVEYVPGGDRRLAVGVVLRDFLQHRPRPVRSRGERVEIAGGARKGTLDIVPAGARHPLQVAAAERDDSTPRRETDDASDDGGDHQSGWSRDRTHNGHKRSQQPCKPIVGAFWRRKRKQECRNDRQNRASPRRRVDAGDEKVEPRREVRTPVLLPVGGVSGAIGFVREQRVKCSVEDEQS